MIEDKKLDEFFGCGVCMGHPECSKINNRDCLYPAGRWFGKQNFEENFGCGVGMRVSGRGKMAHEKLARSLAGTNSRCFTLTILIILFLM